MKKCKKMICNLGVILLIFNFLSSNYAVAASGMKLNRSKITIKVGQSKTIKVVGANKKVKWKNSNKKIVKLSVEKNNRVKITAVGEGKAKIVARVGKKKFCCKITVKSAGATPAPEPTTGATTAPEPTTGATTAPEPTTGATSAPEPTVDATSVPEPTADATPAPEPTPTVKAITSIVLDKTALILDMGDSAAIQAKIYPEDTTESRDVSWSSSDTSVVTVEAGIVTAVGVGHATITAKAGDQQATCVVNVNQTVGSISGNITYFYNNYKGNVSDTGALVLIVPEDGTALQAPVVDSYVAWHFPSMINQHYNKYKVYETEVDGKGEYTFQNIPVGKYKIIVISKKTTAKAAFENNESYVSSMKDLMSDVLNSENAQLLGESVGYQKYTAGEIEVRKNQNTTYSYDFGITYI